MPTAQPSTLESYWTSFEVAPSDVDFIVNLLLEREVPLTSSEMALALVGMRLERLAREAEAVQAPEHRIYLPGETFEVGEKLVFPVLQNRVGEVVAIRDGENPDIGSFKVIKVNFDGDGEGREFAAQLEDHILNHPPEVEAEDDDLNNAETVMTQYGTVVTSRLEEKLDDNPDIVRIAGKWFPKALLADINEGHLNLAEAVLDVASGGPLPTKELIGHLELPTSLSPQLAEFSLDYALQEDERFDEVGPAGQVLWFLQRLEPPEVLFVPPRLEAEVGPIERELLTPELLRLEAQLDDELSEAPAEQGATDDVTISLLFPHWRVGALPLSHRLRKLFPTAYETPRIRFILVDGHSGEKFPGWVVRNHGYVYGLWDWYQKYEVPAGGLVRVRRGEQPGEVIVETKDRRMRNDWIRTVTIDENGQIGFTMLKQPVGTAYDDLMVIGIIDPQAIDEAWAQRSRNRMPLDKTVTHMFRELAKLTPQSAVHAQTLYAAVNVVQRQPPAAVFTELVREAYFEHVGDLYWRLDSSALNAL
ncbi:MAG: hypothetical protein ACK2TX_10040 [Anaerolineales bacterium]